MNNKNLFIIALTGLAIVSASQMTSARDQDDESSRGYQQNRGDDNRDSDHDRGYRIDREINHLNRMLSYVELKMRRYGANRHIWGEFQDVRTDVRRLNNQYHNSDQYQDRRRLRAQIEHIRNDLHHIERELHIRASEWYQWR